MSWISFLSDILVELSIKYFASQSSTHMTFASFQSSKLWHVVWPFIEGNLQFSTHCKQRNNYRATPHCTFFALVASCSFANPCNDGVTSYKRLASPQSHTPMYTTFGLFGKKWNIMLSLDKSLCKIPQWCITFLMYMNAYANFTQFHLKVTSRVCPSISGPFCHDKVRSSIMGKYFLL
jgi:hypothetical protein